VSLYFYRAGATRYGSPQGFRAAGLHDGPSAGCRGIQVEIENIHATISKGKGLPLINADNR
jgi:hypothetical protein